MGAFVNLNRLVNAFEKAGASVEVTESSKGYGRGFARLNDRALNFSFQPSYPDKSKSTVSVIYASSPHTDIMTDCFCDSFFDTIKSAVKYIKGEW
jgi:hypothetical protein